MKSKHWYINFFNYVRSIWEGKNKKPSINRVLAIYFSWNFVSNFSFAVKRWSEGRSLDGLSNALMIEGALIAALLGLTTYYNYMERKTDLENGVSQQGDKDLGTPIKE